MKYEELGKGIVKRTEKRVLGVFIDGTGLDRATRRINRKVDLSALLRGVSSGMPPLVARYYTLIPFEDDSRQRAFLDAVAKAGFDVVVKRLPPKGVTRQVSVDVEMGSDVIAFALGHNQFSSLSIYGQPGHDIVAAPAHGEDTSGTSRPVALFPAGSAFPDNRSGARLRLKPPTQTVQSSQPIASPQAASAEEDAALKNKRAELDKSAAGKHRIITVVCPSRDLAYPISLAREIGADTVTADFGQFNPSDVLKSAAKWIDLSDSETIWRD